MAKEAEKVADSLHNSYQLTDKDIHQLELSDEEYKRYTWEGLRKIIGSFRVRIPETVPTDG
jgi:hypothetical protein